MKGLEQKLASTVAHYRDEAHVFRIDPHPLDELERMAHELASHAAGHEHGKASFLRGKSHTRLALAHGVRARAYHASGALAVHCGLAPMEHLIGEKADERAFTEAALSTAKRLGLDRQTSSFERLAFERLWQIKANGITRDRVRGTPVVCRVVGAFRRYVDDLPVWGRASAVVELARENRVGGVGIDWRPIASEPIDRARVIDPERAARAVLADLAGRLPGSEIADEDFEVVMFSLGYLSLPKRRAQGVLAPVYVAMLKRRGWTTMNHVIVVNGAEKMYESVARLTAAPPRDAVRKRSRPRAV